MALNKRSRLHKVLLTFDESGKYVTGEALFQEGAWDTDTNDWFGEAVEKEYPLTNMTPDGKKFFNDVIGVAAAKALDAAEAWKKELANTQAVNVDLAAKLEAAECNFQNALGARDNFAKLHKEAKAQMIVQGNAHTALVDKEASVRQSLNKIPRLIRKMFGAI